MGQYSTESFEKGLKKLNLSLSEKQIGQFLDYYELLVTWNKVMNLTAITDYEEVIAKHFIDSLASVKVCDFSGKKTVIDIGTGAGFPGIPLKIAFPNLEIVLLDSLNKRIKFLNEVIEKLGLTGIRTIHGRAEDFAKQKEYREQFDFCVSRAVANLSTLSEYCLPYVKVGGKFVPYKSGKIDEEVLQAGKAVNVLGGKIAEVVKFQLMDTDMERSFVIVEKEKNTPKRFPRKAGLPGKEPIV
ncbi:MAG: 16S rRNA (guanine(527)-N(7))-methyltransferase RsmG [Clostridiales bacterium]|nr:16S rRNA (guanine(527)-N(7))-methyltransferase RsmG [Clostridiales bacterium]